MKRVLRTDRLLLEPFSRASVDPFLRIVNQESVRSFLCDGEPITASQADRLLVESERSFTDHGFGLWIISREPNAVIGFAGLRRRGETDRIELIFGISADDWGMGYAAEAVGRIISYAGTSIGLQTVEASTQPANSRAVRLLRRLGMTPSGTEESAVGTLWIFIHAGHPSTARGIEYVA